MLLFSPIVNDSFTKTGREILHLIAEESSSIIDSTSIIETQARIINVDIRITYETIIALRQVIYS